SLCTRLAPFALPVPPCSTLFPYTTLFRSTGNGRAPKWRRMSRATPGRHNSVLLPSEADAGGTPPGAPSLAQGPARAPAGPNQCRTRTQPQLDQTQPQLDQGRARARAGSQQDLTILLLRRGRPLPPPAN